MAGGEASSPGKPKEEGHGKGISEYEKQRLSRIKENRARLEALGLAHLSSSLLGSVKKKQQPKEEEKGKKKTNQTKNGDKEVGGDDDDDEYRPSDEEEDFDDDDEDDDGEESSSSSGSRRAPKRKGKNKQSYNAAHDRKNLYLQEVGESDFTDEDAALQQAIALSLGDATEDSAAQFGGVTHNSGTNTANVGASRKNDRVNIQDTAGKRKRRKGSVSRVQLTEDEVVAYFFSFDEAGKGHIALRDLQRMAIAHDFCWTEIEIANMIHCFDRDGDGKLNLEEFRTIVSRCNMMQEPGTCMKSS